MSDIATIALRVNTSELERGNKALDDFKGSAAGAAKGADDFGNSTKGAGKVTADAAREINEIHQRVRAFTEAQRQNQGSTKGASQATVQQQQELQNLLNRISPVNRALNDLDDLQTSLSKHRNTLDTETYSRYNGILDTTRAKLAQVMEMETAEGRARHEQAQAAQRAVAAGQSFISSLQDQANAIDKTRSELLEMKAAQLGVATQAAPMIARLREQENAWKRGEISAGQYRQAMRMLPAQFTDIATSIAGGMPIWMMAIQQGGQIKDSFGGISNTLKALGSLITPARLLVGGLAAGVTVAAVAAYQGSQEFTEYRKQLVLTGDYAGKTAEQLNQLAKSLSGNGVTQGAVASVLAQVVGSGKFDASKIETVTRAAVTMEKATGQAVTETISNFQKLYDSPTRASEELNKQLHYLTSAQYEYISSLERRGDKEQAGEAAADAYSKSQQDRAKQVVERLGWIERAASGVSNAAKSMWDDLLNLGRQTSLQDELDQVNDSLKLGVFPRWGDQSETALKAHKSLLENVIRAQGVFGDVQNIAKKADDARTDSLVYQNQILSKNMSWQENRARALKELWDNVAKAPEKWSEAQRKLAVAQINQDNKAPSAPKAKAFVTSAGDRTQDNGQSELLALQAQYQVLQQHSSINDVISQQRKDLWKTESQFTVLEEASRARQLTKQEQSLLASKDQVLQLARQKALLGDQITAQEQLNKRMDTAQKYANKMAEKSAALNIGSGMSDRLAQREMAKSQLASGWKNAGGNLSEKGYQDELRAAQNYYAAEDALRGNWQKGVQKGWSEFADGATNVYAQVENVTKNAFTGMSSILTDFFTTGKASFKDFLTTFLKGIVQMTTQIMLLNSMKMLTGGTSFGALLGFNAGGYTGDGGKHQPKGVVHGGEFVFTKEATQRIGVPTLYGMMRGYADGGHVGGTAPAHVMQPSGNRTAGFVMNNVFNVNGQQTQSTFTGSFTGGGRAIKDQIIGIFSQQLDKALGQSGRISTFVNNRIGR